MKIFLNFTETLNPHDRIKHWSEDEIERLNEIPWFGLSYVQNLMKLVNETGAEIIVHQQGIQTYTAVDILSSMVGVEIKDFVPYSSDARYIEKFIKTSPDDYLIIDLTIDSDNENIVEIGDKGLTELITNDIIKKINGDTKNETISVIK